MYRLPPAETASREPRSPLTAGSAIARRLHGGYNRAAMGDGDDARRMLDYLPVLSWRGLPDGSKDFFNHRWHQYTGLSPAQASGSGWQVTIHPDDVPGVAEKWHEVVTSSRGGEIEARLRRFDGSYRWFLCRAEPVRDEQGAIVAWYGTDTDIEDRKRAEGELRRMLDAIPQTIVVLDPEGKVVTANRTALGYTGLELDQVVHTDWRDLVFHPEDVERLREERQRGLARGVPFSLEWRARGKDRQYRWFLIQYNPLRDEQGRLVHWYATGTDIDDRKRAEQSVRNENQALRDEIDRSSMFEEIVGSSAPLQYVLEQVARVAGADTTVLILGETGTGKELIARAIHRGSKRATRAFIRVNCAAIPPSLTASELFGHEKGAFTGAVQRRIGRFEAADGGTIFLDEVGELPAETQVSLLRVLQEREIERVGSSHPIAVDVRVLAATNRDLEAAVERGTFREDLFYRLNVFPIRLPPLRERADDIPILVEYLVDRFGKQTGKRICSVERSTLRRLQDYDWPGNVRELQNVIERAVVLSEGETFAIDQSWLGRKQSKPSRATSVTTLADGERALIEAALTESQGRVSGPRGAAARLGIPRQTLEWKIRTFQIDKLAFRKR